MCSNGGSKPTDPSTKHYRDPSGKIVNTPGSTGYVCIDTRDGETVCRWFSRRVFDWPNTLSAPGEYCTPDYTRPGNASKCTYGPVQPSKFKTFDS